MKFNSDNPSQPPTPTSMNSDLDRFNLLSAYIDGKVTSSERQKVQEWLDTDKIMQQKYRQLLRLQQEMSNLPLPESPVVASVLSDQLFRTIDHRQSQRRLVIAGGFAIAALITGLLSQLYLRDNQFSPKLASKTVIPTQIQGDPLTIALNRPIVEIPAVE